MDLSSLFLQIPWLAPTLEWILAIFVAFFIWVILSFPAFILEKLIDKTLTAYNAYLSSFSKLVKNDFESFEMRTGNRFQKFFDCHNVRATLTWGRKPWCLALVSTNRSLKQIIKSLRQSGKILTRYVKRSKSLEHNVRGIESRFHKLSESPININFENERKYATRSAISTVFSIILVLSLVIVNVGVLNRILQELGIGLFTVFGSVKLYHVIAFLLTLIESGLGIAYGYVKSEAEAKDKENITFPIAQYFPMAGALMLAFVEGFFYSRLGLVIETETLTFGQFEFGMEQALFLLGFTLPIALFGLGDVMFRSLVNLLENTSMYRLERRLIAYKRQAAVVDARLDDLGRHWLESRKEGSKVIEDLPVVSREREQELIIQFNEIISKLRDVLRTKPDVNVTIPMSHDDDATKSYYVFRIGITLIITVLAIVLGIYLQFNILPKTHFEMNSTQASILAASKSVSMLLAGLYLQAPFLTTDSNGRSNLEFGVSQRITTITAAFVVLLGLGFDFYLLFWGGIESFDKLGWVLVMAADMVFVLVGRELPSMLALFMPTIWMLLEMAVLGLRGLIILILYLLSVLFALIRFGLSVLSAPLSWYLFTRRKKQKNEVLAN